ncbi:hypothetical protein [Bandra megavirus]|uniref:MYM-type domain-containing protein n=1 Tax=Bandra megavirus TaxID=2071566 RepID=A0A2K9V7C1_9VIRU|nr:hypothetical protein [Bandra megavirus]
MFLHPSYNDNLFTTKCGMCDLDAKAEYRSGTVTYYRNKNSSIHNFCSAECMDKYNRTKKCWFCSYHSDLVSTDSGFMVCTSTEYWDFSCLDKYNIRKNHNLILEWNPFCDDDYEILSKSDIIPDEYKEYLVNNNDDNDNNDDNNDNDDDNDNDNNDDDNNDI